MQTQMCIACQEAITNPICPGCVEKEINAWLYEKDQALIKTPFHKVNYRSTRCIICSDQTDLCSYCFAKDTLESIKDKKVASEFAKTFGLN